MSAPAITSAGTSRRRRSWSIFWTVSLAAVGTCFFATLWSSGAVGAGLVLLGAFLLVGIAAAMMYSIVEPFPDQLTGSRGTRSGFGESGGFDGSGGDCGGGGGDCG